MRHEDVFLLEIRDNPHDDVPRRIFADWLLDHPDEVHAARGEFIHLQCDLAHIGPDAPRPTDLVRRERKLLEQYGRDWGRPFSRLGCRCWEYHRGFVEGVGLPASVFLAHADELLSEAPVRELKLYDVDDLLARVAAHPALAGMRTLDLEKNDLGDGDLETLLASPHLSGLRTLQLWSNRIGDDGARALAYANLPALERLDLSGNVVGNAGLATLAASPLLARLVLLDLTGNSISDPGALALAGSPQPMRDNLRLDLSKNPIDPVGLAALRERFGSRLQALGLGDMA